MSETRLAVIGIGAILQMASMIGLPLWMIAYQLSEIKSLLHVRLRPASEPKK